MSKHTAGTHGAAAGPAALPRAGFPAGAPFPHRRHPEACPGRCRPALPCPAPAPGGPRRRWRPRAAPNLPRAGRAGARRCCPPPPFPPPAAAAAPAPPPPRGASQPAAALRLHPPPAANAERPRRGVTEGAGNASPTPPRFLEGGRGGGVGAPPPRCPLPVPRAGGPPQAAFRAVCSLFCKACLFSSAASRIYTGTWAVFPCFV